jgi:hypothetical protein
VYRYLSSHPWGLVPETFMHRCTGWRWGSAYQHRYLFPLATQEAEVRKIMVQSQSQEDSSWDPSQKYLTQKRAGGVAHVVECLPSKHEAQSSKPSTAKKINIDNLVKEGPWFKELLRLNPSENNLKFPDTSKIMYEWVDRSFSKNDNNLTYFIMLPVNKLGKLKEAFLNCW